jgi:XisI protein
MEKIREFEEIILSLLQEEAGNWHNESPQALVIVDREKRHYQLILNGWTDNGVYMDDILVHFHISDDERVWLLQNNTEWLVAEDLVRRGVPADEIVIGFHPPKYRKYTDYAVS